MKFLSKYALGIRIGKGYSGSVFKCTMRKNGEIYACKIISGKKSVERNNKELDILRPLEHKHINIIEEVFHENIKRKSINYVVSQLGNGDILDYCKENYVTEEVAKHFIKQILEGVNYLHKNNVCHCDLKLENILYVDTTQKKYYCDDVLKEYKPNFKNIQLKLIDFEFSKYIYGNRKMLTGRNGTISFMAPEILKNHTYNELVDMWSIGVITYSLLFNTYPIIYTRIEVADSYKIKYYNRPNISEHAINFMKQLLVEDPDYRMNAEEALQHEWLQHY